MLGVLWPILMKTTAFIKLLLVRAFVRPKQEKNNDRNYH